MKPENYWRPDTLEHAIDHLKHEADSVALCGGALLLAGLTPPYAGVVDLQDVPGLGRLEQDAEGLHIGGGATLQSVVEAAFVPAELKRSITRTMPLNIRNATSAGESLVAPYAPVEWLAMLAVLGTEVEHILPQQGAEAVLMPLPDFLAALDGPYRGIVLALHIPPQPAGMYLSSAFVARTPADMPIVNVALRLVLDESGRVLQTAVVLGGAGAAAVVPVALPGLAGAALSAALIDEAAAAVPGQVQPVGDYRGSVEYRQAMAGVLVRRALLSCLARVGK